MRRIAIYGTTDGSGDLVAQATVTQTGLLYGLYYDAGTFADGVDVVVATVNAESARTILTITNGNDSAMYSPRDNEHDTSGTSLGAGALFVVDGLLQITVSSGGDTLTGGIVAYILD